MHGPYQITCSGQWLFGYLMALTTQTVYIRMKLDTIATDIMRYKHTIKASYPRCSVWGNKSPRLSCLDLANQNKTENNQVKCQKSNIMLNRTKVIHTYLPDTQQKPDNHTNTVW